MKRNILRPILFVLIACAVPFHISSAGLYRWTDENGAVHFSDTPPQESQTAVETLSVEPNNSSVKPNNLPTTVDKNYPVRMGARRFSRTNLPPKENRMMPLEKKTENYKPLQRYDLSAYDRLKSCDPSIAVDAAEEIVNNPDTLKEPLNLFLPASVFIKHGKKDEAVFWFYAAELRVRYQLIFDNNDDTGQLLTVMGMTVGPPILNYAFQDISNCCRILDRVLEWDKKAPNPFREKPKSKSINNKIESIYIGLNDYKTKLVTEKSDLETKAREAAPEMERTYGKLNSPCKEGQIDPAYARLEREREQTLVVDFVKNNRDVILQAGGIKKVFIGTYRTSPGQVMPDSYIVYVEGKNGKYIYPIIGVSRSRGNVKFNLECISHINVDPAQDPCSQ